ncbi:MAG: glycerophosphodiester phosphodiesterase [Elusimicrobiota bacterium]
MTVLSKSSQGGVSTLKRYSVRLKAPGKLPWVIGHRGAMGHAPENTMASFEQAFHLGSDMLEFDVRLTKDNIPVVVHDCNLDRTSNKPLRVNELMAKDIIELDAGSWFDLRFAGERIPRLSTLLKWAAPKKNKAGQPATFFVELKVDGDEKRRETLIQAVLKELKDNKVINRSVVISFDEPILAMLHKLSPTTASGFLYSDFLYDALDRAKNLKTNHILPRKDRVTGDLVEEAHQAGMSVVAWTADRLDEFRKLVVWGVDGIATNYPDRLIEFYDR